MEKDSQLLESTSMSSLRLPRLALYINGKQGFCGIGTEEDRISWDEPYA